MRISQWQRSIMLKFLSAIFLFPGTLLINAIGISATEDGGILRGMTNMIFWGILIVIVALGIAI